MSIAYRSALIGAAFSVCFGMANARAQEGTTFITFQGSLFVLDNPTSVACAAKNVNFGNIYEVIYRFSLNPAVDPDAFAIRSQRSEAVMFSTQSPGFSLNGASTTSWDGINKYAFTGSIASSSSNLTIKGGGGPVPISSASGVARISGSINDFLAIPGCNVGSIEAALVLSPD